jgi:hypothetical protein
MRDIEAKNNAMLRMQMTEIQRKTQNTERTYSIEKKKNSIQEKVEKKMKLDVLEKLTKHGIYSSSLSSEVDKIQETEGSLT